MATGDNAVVAVHEPADEVTCYCVAAVTGGRFVKINRDIPGGVAANAWAGTENPQISQAAAADVPVGVSRYDGVIGDNIPVLMANQIIPMKAGAAVAAGVAVQPDANGQPITLASGVKAGVALTAAAALNDIILVKLQLG
jgi:hypothetical protein